MDPARVAIGFATRAGEVGAGLLPFTAAQGLLAEGGRAVDRTRGRIEDGDLTAGRQPAGGDHGEQGGPAGQRAARDVYPVNPFGQRHGVPVGLPGERLLL